MKKTVAIATSAFISGFISCIIVIAAITLLAQRSGIGELFESEIYARGELQYEQVIDQTASGLPPEGYYIASTAIDRIYILEGESIEEFLSSSIQVRGAVKTICGGDGFVCYPAIKDASITPLN